MPVRLGHEAIEAAKKAASLKGMTLTALVPMSQGQLTDDQVKTVQADLDKIN